MLRLSLAVCLATAPFLVTATTIYKVQMPDGSVLYSDNVPAGGKVLEEREAKSTPRISTPPSTAPGKAPPPTAAAARPGVPPNTKLGTATDNIYNLERELAVARRKLELGREPLPGERLGLAGGGSRLTPEYEARIAGLEREVEATEARLKRAYEARNAAR